MSYINFYEKEYNNGKINLDEVSKKRKYYNSLDAGASDLHIFVDFERYSVEVVDNGRSNGRPCRMC